MSRCATPLGIPPLRPELQAAHDDMGREPGFFAWAVCPTWEGLAWEVNTRMGGIFSALEARFPTRADAEAAGHAWLAEQHARSLTTDEQAYRQLWEAR